MPFQVHQLLLTPEREAQLTAALANAAHPTPLADLVAEAEARVNLLSTGRALTDDQRNQLIRAIALHSAYGLVGPVPKDIEVLYGEAMKLWDLVTRWSPTSPAPFSSSEPKVKTRL